MSGCPGAAAAWYAAEPSWFDQADKQMSDLYGTLSEIGDETILDAFDALEDRITTAKRNGRGDE